MTAAVWVEQAVGWQWWIGTLLTMGLGGLMGWVARGWYAREIEREDEVDEARRVARIYQREIEAARRRHPSGR